MNRGQRPLPLKPIQRTSAMFAMAALLFAGAAPNVQAYYNVIIGNTDTAGIWNGNE